MDTAQPGVSASKKWRILAWTNAALYVALAVTLAPAGVVWMQVGLSATRTTRSPEQSGAAMMFAMLGGLVACIAIALLAVGVTSGFVARRLRRRAAGIPTIIFLSLAGLGPLILLACVVFLR